jgi:hypothetical protein
VGTQSIFTGTISLEPGVVLGLILLITAQSIQVYGLDYLHPFGNSISMPYTSIREQIGRGYTPNKAKQEGKIAVKRVSEID